MSSSDSEDEIGQDWRFLDAKVLKRGEKDHAPDGTNLQQSFLDQSRQAMYTALSKPATVALKTLVEGDWDNVRQIAKIRKLKGNFFLTMGWAERENMFLLPEEILYLVQRGSMRLYLNNEILTEHGVTSLLLPLVGIDKLHVYTHFKRLGFIVRRDDYSKYEQFDSKLVKNYRSPWLTSIAWAIGGSFFNSMAWRSAYPNYDTIYRDLRCLNIKFDGGDKLVSSNFDYLVWRPGSQFKKSAPPYPDYRIRVKSADEPLPSLEEMEADFNLVPTTVNTKGNIIQRMRSGYRDFIYAIVDNGVVSFIRLAETYAEPCVNEPDPKLLNDLDLVIH